VKGQTLEENNDCIKYYKFTVGIDYNINEDCCKKDSAVICDNNGYIKSININFYLPNKNENYMNSFPYFSRIEQFLIGLGLKGIPNSILNLTSLKHLNVINNNIGNIPPGIKNLSNLEKLNLSENQIEGISSDINNLSKLKELNLNSNNIKEIPNEIFSLKDLTTLDLNTNKIKVIPSTIKNLLNLERLYLSNNNIEKLPNEIFSLTNLKEFEFQNNPNLKTKMIKFGDSTIQNCNFIDVNIECYEPHACKSIFYENNKYTDSEFQKEYKLCTKEEINEILRGLNINRKSNISNFLLIILGFLIIIFIGVLITFMLIKKKIFSKKNKILDSDPNAVFRNGSIRVLLNINNKNNVEMNRNSNNNSNVEISSSSNNNTNVEIGSSSNYNTNVEIGSSSNSKIFLASLYSNDNNNEQNTNDYMFDLQAPPPSYNDESNTLINNNINNNEIGIFNSSFDLSDDPLPGYTSFIN